MDWTLAAYVACVAIGSYVQSVTGFAMGMIIIAVLAGGGLIGIPALTATVSLLSLVNVALSLRGKVHLLHRGLFTWLSLGQIPAIGFGLWLMLRLDADALWVLELTLGVFITLGSLSMMLRPRPIARVSSPVAALEAGVAGGMIGGMFSASGPVIGWFNYRQPLSFNEIRATLFGCFALTTSVRTLYVGIEGGLTGEVWLYAFTGLPIVLGATWLGRNFPPPLGEDAMKRLAFALLVVMGLWTIAGALARAG
jgi:uncharacterized membrane protein YfcA